METSETNKTLILSIKKAYLNSIDDLNISNGWNETILPVIKQALQERERITKSESKQIQKEKLESIYESDSCECGNCNKLRAHLLVLGK